MSPDNVTDAQHKIRVLVYNPTELSAERVTLMFRAREIPSSNHRPVTSHSV
jgi:hypothetical protein